MNKKKLLIAFVIIPIFFISCAQAIHKSKSKSYQSKIRPDPPLPWAWKCSVVSCPGGISIAPNSYGRFVAVIDDLIILVVSKGRANNGSANKWWLGFFIRGKEG